MNIETNGKLVSIEMKFGEDLGIGFNPEGINAVIGQKTIGFRVGTLNFFNGRMALILRLPSSHLYKRGNCLVILDDPNQADSLTFDDQVYIKVKDIGYNES